jgi:MFS family permease
MSTYFFGALGGLLFGYDLGVVAGALLYIKPEFGLTSAGEGFVTSSLLLGAMIGALGCGAVSQKYGRRRVVMGSGVLFAAGALAASLASGLAVLLTGRLVMGLAVGALSVSVPIYLSEITPAASRGGLSGRPRPGPRARLAVDVRPGPGAGGGAARRAVVPAGEPALAGAAGPAGRGPCRPGT